MSNRLSLLIVSVSALVVFGSSFSYAGIYFGETNDAAYISLSNQVEAVYSALTNQMATAEGLGVNTDYAQVTQVTLELFKDEYAPWDRANPDKIDYAYTEKAIFATADPVYAAYGAAGLPFDELADCLEIAQAATNELQQQIDGAIELQDPPDFSTGTMTLNNAHYELDGQKVIPSRFFWQPENDEDIWQAFGRMGASFYGLYWNMTDTNTANNNAVVNDVKNLASEGASPVEFWHATVVGNVTTNHWMWDYPETVLGDGYRFFNEYDIDSPLVRQWESNLFNKVMAPALSELGTGLRYHLLNNEPRFPIRQGNGDSRHNVSSYTYDNFAVWLADKYSTFSNLNAVYGTGYASFAQASTANYVVNDGVSETLQGGPIWYDWCKFNQERVNDWHTFLNDSVKSIDSTPSTHIKVWGEGSIHTPYQDQGIDYEYLSKMVDLPGSDSQCTPLKSEYENRENDDWKNRYAFEWRNQAVMMDFIKSMSPDKPYLDSEWHGFLGTRWRDFHMEEEYVRAILWMSAQQGLSSINAWFWNRNYTSSDPAVRNGYRQRVEFVGGPAVEPIMMNAFGRTMKEINAHADTFASMVPELRHYIVYYNKDSAIQDNTYSDNMTDVFEALKLLNVPVGFTTPTELASVSNAMQTVIVPRTEYISAADLAALESFKSEGGEIVLVDSASCFMKTELGAVRAGGTSLTNCTSVSHNEAVYTMAADFEAVLVSRKPDQPVQCSITDTNSGKSYGVICAQSEDLVSGVQIVSLINLSQDPRVVSLSTSELGSVTNLITGQTGTNVVVMAPQDVLLLRLENTGSDNPLWNSFVSEYELSGVRTNNADVDRLTDWGEYIFGGNPTNPADEGLLPFFNAASGDYSFYLRNDNSLIARVVSTTNLQGGVWATNDIVDVLASDGLMGTNATSIGTTNEQLFIKLLVDESGPFNFAPSFTADPFSKPNAVKDVAYNSSISGDASDPESDPLTFSKVSGPVWLHVATNGALSGTPLVGNVGTNQFDVRVEAIGGSDAATLEIIVDASTGIEVLTHDDFEDALDNAGWGSWTEGGNGVDSRRLDNASYAIGSYSLNIRDDTGDDASVLLESPLDLSSRTQLTIGFSYYPRGMEAGEDFWVQFSDNNGASWTTVATYISGTTFTNDVRAFPQVILDSGSYSFTTNVNIRFVCDASEDNDNVYLDNIVITAQ